MLNSGEFISLLSKFDASTLQNKQIKKKLRECIPFSVEEVTSLNATCGTLLQWVKCMEAIVTIRFPDKVKTTKADAGERNQMM